MCAGIHDHDDPRFSCDCHLHPVPGVDCCEECEAPFDDADAPPSGLCAACEA